MRLRKHTVKTEFLERPQQFSRFKLLKRQATQIMTFPPRRSNEHRPQDKYQMRFSSQNSSNFTELKYFGNLSEQVKKQPWKKIRMPFAKMGKNTSIRKSAGNDDQIKLLTNHIANLSRKTIRSHKRTATEPCLSLKSSRQRKEKLEREPMEKKHFERCCEIVDEIYVKIKLLKELGYADFKINEWVLSYCDNRRPYMKDIFMRNVSKSLYTLQQEYEFQKNSTTIKEKIKYKIEKGRQTFFFIQAEELAQFCKYIQEILIQKNSQKAKEVESSIIEKLSNELVPRLKNKFFVFTKKEPAEVSNFMTDLSQYEHKYGDFLSLSKVNKLRFLQLNRVQENLKKIYQSMLQSQIRKFVKENHEHPQIGLKNPQKANK